MDDKFPLVAFCHLRWDFVYQRPQHVLSRLAASRRVIVIEEPVHAPDSASYWERVPASSPVEVYRPRTPPHAAGFSSAQLPYLDRMLRALARKQRIDRCVAWLYTPMALPLTGALAPDLLVYDCMDELAAFLHAPAELTARERELLACADLIFTGGRSLYRSKQELHRDVHCFPSSVDVAHFARAMDGAVEPEVQRAIPRPRLGFAGVIDERLDRELLDAVARARPDWQIVMVGPIAKIDPASLPRHPNLHYLGQQPYAALPGFLAGWDVGLLPFALNRTTRFISPTKTLEYMAAELPIVSTPIVDVAEPYGDVVHLGDGAQAFIAACARALGEPEPVCAARAARMRAIVAGTSWDTTVDAMADLIDARLASRMAGRAVEPPVLVSADRTTRSASISGGTS